MSAWISVKKQLPEEGLGVTVWRVPATGKAHRADGFWITLHGEGEVGFRWCVRPSLETAWTITHWQPLPEPPEEGT